MTAPTQPPQSGLTPTQIAALIALVDAQSRVRAQLTRAAIAAAVGAFAAITNWWDIDQVRSAVKATLRVVQANQRQAARITDAYIARTATVMTGRTTAPAGAVEVTKLRRDMAESVARDLVEGRIEPAYVLLGEHDPANRRVVPAETINAPATMAIPDPGETPLARVRRQRAEKAAAAAKALDPGEAYGRVAEQYRYGVIANGEDESTARAKALVRIEAVAQTDVTLAVREQVRKSVGKLRNVKGYRRVLRPELSEEGPCGLCVVAADRVYHVEELKPIHDRCVCEVLPIIGSLDPGLELNSDDLDAIYDAAGGTGGEVVRGRKRHSAALKKIRVALAEHGELGPVLVNADHKFRGPTKVAATKVPDRAVRAQAQLESLDKKFAELQRRLQAGDSSVARAIEWQENAIAKLRRELAGAA